MSELSCDTLFIGRNETHDLSLYLVELAEVSEHERNHWALNYA